MTDAARREAERDASAGDLHAAARLLVERVRSGDLPQERLELAAHLRDPAACLALGRELTPVTVLGAWADEVEGWGEEARARLCVAAVTAVVPPWRWLRPADEVFPLAVEALRRGLDRPPELEACRERLLSIGGLPDERARDALRALAEALAVVEALHGPGTRGWLTASAAVRAAAGAYVGGLDGFVAALRADLLPWVLRAPGTARGP